MGFPLRSNIFRRTNSQEQNYFAKFPIQVAVLFSPGDLDFGDAFRQIFVHLDRLTGEKVVFFAVLDPPEAWKDIARGRSWWQQYQQTIGKSDFTYDDRTLVMEIARLFDVTWAELPVLIASTNLWSTESVICPTSQWHIEQQLTALTRLAEKWEQPNIHHIIEALQDSHGSAVQYSPANMEKRIQITSFYNYLDLCHDLNERFDLHGFERMYGRTSSRIRSQMFFDPQRPARYDNPRRSNSALEIDPDPSVDSLLLNVAGQLIAPATVFSRLQSKGLFLSSGEVIHTIPNSENLEEASLTMIEGALRIGSLLESENQIISPKFPSNRPQDFSPAAQGIWKAIENEMNFSIIQAIRCSRTIRMPDFFTQYDPGTVDENLTIVKTPYKVSINQKDNKKARLGRHVFLEIGKGYHATQAVIKLQEVVLNKIIESSLGQPFPKSQLDAWSKLIDLRNKGSHTDMLTRDEFRQVMEISQSGLLDSFIKIKNLMKK